MKQQGRRHTWLRTIGFDYLTLSPDALYLFSAIHWGCFLNESSAAESVLDVSVEEESWLAHMDADRYPVERTNSTRLSSLNVGEWDREWTEGVCAFKSL